MKLKGFSLMELLIAVGILAFALVPLTYHLINFGEFIRLIDNKTKVQNALKRIEVNYAINKKVFDFYEVISIAKDGVSGMVISTNKNDIVKIYPAEVDLETGRYQQLNSDNVKDKDFFILLESLYGTIPIGIIDKSYGLTKFSIQETKFGDTIVDFYGKYCYEYKMNQENETSCGIINMH